MCSGPDANSGSETRTRGGREAKSKASVYLLEIWRRSEDSLFSGQVPRRIVIGLVDTEAFSGKISKNPFNFQHYDLNFLCAHVDGERFPSRPLTPDFDNGHFLEAYETLFVGTGIYNSDRYQMPGIRTRLRHVYHTTYAR